MATASATASGTPASATPPNLKLMDGLSGPFTKPEFISYYGAKEGEERWAKELASHLKKNEKRMDGKHGPYSFQEFKDVSSLSAYF